MHVVVYCRQAVVKKYLLCNRSGFKNYMCFFKLILLPVFNADNLYFYRYEVFC
jgi:hypothetical protein